MSLNKVMLIGNVGKDPEIRYLDNNTQQGGNATRVASLTLATTERYRDRNGDIKENTEWHNIVAWRQLAEICEKYVRKGTQIYVEGRLRTRSWDDQNGNKKYTTEIIADSLQLLGKKSDNPANGQQGGGYQSNQGGQYANQYGNNARPAYQQPAPQTQQNPAPSPFQAQDAEESDDLPF